MASQRLQVWQKDSIVSALINHAFGARKESLVKDEQNLADVIYCSAYSPEELERMCSLPKGWLPTATQFTVKFGDNGWTTVDWGKERPIQEKSKGRAFIFDHHHDYTARYFRIQGIRKQLQEEERQARSSASAVVRNVSTYKRLIELWPECEPFAAKHKAAAVPPPTTALAIPINDLNKAFGLPVKP